MEVEIINSFLPDLVTAISDSVQSVSNQCLAKGLISDTVYKRVSESVGTSEDKARILTLAVKKSTETDSQCFELLLGILNETLPFVIKDQLLPKINKGFTEKVNAAESDVSITFQSKRTATEDLKECILEQEKYLGQFEDSVRQHAHACGEKESVNESLKKQKEDIERLTKELESQVTCDSESKNATMQEKLLACEAKAKETKERIAVLESTVEEQSMKVRRRRSVIMLAVTKHLSDHKREMNQRKDNGLVPVTTNDETAQDEAVSTLQASLKAVEEQMKQEKAQQEKRLMDIEKKLRDLEKQLEVKEYQAKGGIILPANYTPLHEPDNASLSLSSILGQYYSEKICNKWEDIGILLEIDHTIMDQIKSEGRTAKQCLNILYKVWLRRIDPPPARYKLSKIIQKLGLEEDY